MTDDNLAGFDAVLPQSWADIDARPLPGWYPGAKFGIFIHWGVFSVPAWRTLKNEQFGSYAEWYYASVYGKYRNADTGFHDAMFPGRDYHDLAEGFGAELFDPHSWAELFRRAGARYVVLTSKHHDGFCLWPTDNRHKTEWNAGAIGPKRDLVGDLSEAVREAGLKMGLYYSIPEWETNTSHRMNGEHFIPEADAERYGIPEADYPREILHQQWVEFNERYAPSVIYTDGGEWDFPEEYTDTRRMLTWLYTQAPNKDEVVVNDRIHVGMPGIHGDIYSTEYQDVEGFGQTHPWEESRGIGGSYGFNRAENIEDYACAAELATMLARTVAGGGNFLLNVGPTADGRIDNVQQERLLQLGAWLETAGAAIYDSQPSPDVHAAPGTGVEGAGAEASARGEVFVTAAAGNRYAIVPGRPAEVALTVEPGTSVTGWKLLGAEPDAAQQLLDVRVDQATGEAGTVTIWLSPAARWTASASEPMPLVIELEVDEA